MTSIAYGFASELIKIAYPEFGTTTAAGPAVSINWNHTGPDNQLITPTFAKSPAPMVPSAAPVPAAAKPAQAAVIPPSSLRHSVVSGVTNTALKDVSNSVLTAGIGGAGAAMGGGHGFSPGQSLAAAALGAAGGFLIPKAINYAAPRLKRWVGGMFPKQAEFHDAFMDEMTKLGYGAGEWLGMAAPKNPADNQAMTSSYDAKPPKQPAMGFPLKTSAVTPSADPTVNASRFQAVQGMGDAIRNKVKSGFMPEMGAVHGAA